MKDTDMTEPSDIVERLRAEGADAMSKHLSMGMWKLCDEAAAEITRLRAALDEAFIQGLENAADIAKGERIEDILRRKVEHLRQSRL